MLNAISIGFQFLRQFLAWRSLTRILFLVAIFVPAAAYSQPESSSEYDAALNQARTLLRSAVWNNRYDSALRESVNLAITAAEEAKSTWGAQDIRYRRAISVYAVAMSQHTLGLILKSKGSTTKSANLVETMTTEAGSIASNETGDGELAMMATLIKARLARITGDTGRSRELYDFVVQTLESIMAPDHPVLVAVKAERG